MNKTELLEDIKNNPQHYTLASDDWLDALEKGPYNDNKSYINLSLIKAMLKCVMLDHPEMEELRQKKYSHDTELTWEEEKKLESFRHQLYLLAFNLYNIYKLKGEVLEDYKPYDIYDERIIDGLTIVWAEIRHDIGQNQRTEKMDEVALAFAGFQWDREGIELYKNKHPEMDEYDLEEMSDVSEVY